MPPATKAARQHESEPNTKSATESALYSARSGLSAVPRRLPNALAGAQPQKRPVTAPPSRQNGLVFQPRVPVLQGEATYRGSLPVDGIISGHLGSGGNALTIKQRPKNGAAESAPELEGEITFKDMLRVNGYIAGSIFSERGTLIIDTSARVDACIDVAVAVISGTVNGDITGRERVEIGPGATINGNIVTRSISLKPGAVFEGDCRILKAENGDL